MTKKLRGWSLEKELPQANFSSFSSSSSGAASSLATKLLFHWAHGALSAVAIQEIAHLAVLDGARHPELVKLAQAGNFGEFTGNIHREIVTSFCKNV